MPHATLVNATDLNFWAQRLDARHQLPRLLRRLVHATVSRTQDIQRIDFAADESIQLPGWDGIVKADAGNAWVPTGVSGWEMGVNDDIKGKADSDYRKRSENSLGLNCAETTFVFVTPRRWAGKATWVRERNAENIWGEVRAYDGEDLTQWLEQAPAVHLWFSSLLGKLAPGVSSIDTFWIDWAGASQPPLSTDLVIGGRTQMLERLVGWLRGDPSTLTLRGESPEEATAFLAAVVHGLEDEERRSCLSRAVVVEDTESWRTLISSPTPLLLVGRLDAHEGIARAVTNGHHVFLPMGRAGVTDDPSLPRLNRDAAEIALRQMGLSHDRASDLATLARRSLPALRRKLAMHGGIQIPAWAHAVEARALLAPLLTGSWYDSLEPDQEFLSRLAGLPYSELRAIALRWSNEPDSPLIRVGDLWMLASREDAWRLIARYLTGDDMRNFESVALEVLVKRDPIQQLSDAERLAAQMLGHTTISQSGYLREGIAETFALMSALSGDVPFASGENGEGEGVARRVIRSIFHEAKDDVSLWASLESLLPLLAEAAPVVFLDAVEAGLQGDSPLLKGLFRDNDEAGYSALFGSSPHTGLLWALETVAWRQEYLGRAALLLARLAQIEPGGKMGNRPKSSLRSIFHPWFPNTTAPLQNRLAVLNNLRRREPEVTWRLMLQLLPSRNSSVFPTHGARWRDWKPDELEHSTVQQFLEFTDAILERMLADVGVDSAHWCDLFPHMSELTPEQRERLLGRLEALDTGAISPEGLMQLRAGLRKTLTRHRAAPDMDWAMPTEHLDRLEAVYEAMSPEDVIMRQLWLFEQHVQVPGLARRGWHERTEALESLRIQALRDVMEAQGWEGVLRLTASAQVPYYVGWALERSGLLPVDLDAFLSENLAGSSPWSRALARGFTSAAIASNAEAWEVWVEERLMVASNTTPVWRAEQYGDFFLCLPFVPKTLDLFDALDESVIEDAQRNFWSRADHITFPQEPEQSGQAERVLTQLLRFQRFHFTVQALAWSLHSDKTSGIIAPERIAETLEAAIAAPIPTDVSSDSVSNFAQDSAELLSYLEKTELPRNRLAQLEFLYLRLHQHYRQPKIWHDELASDPNLFIDALKHVYGTKKTNKEETVETGTSNELNVGVEAAGENRADVKEASEQKVEHEGDDELDREGVQESRVLATLIGDLLRSWEQIPGRREDGTLDGDGLKTWVHQVRELAAESDRLEAADYYIGQLFAFSPVGIDGAWPHESVRDLVDDLASVKIDGAWITQIFNNRGVVSRGLTDGGEQERELAAKYEGYANAFADEWPRTAGILREFAADYMRRAAQQDQRAQLTQDRWR